MGCGCEARARGLTRAVRRHAPLHEAVEEHRIVRAQHEHEVEPALGEEVGGVVLEQHAARTHARVELVDDAALGRLVEQQRVRRSVAARVQALGSDELAHIHVREARALRGELREGRLPAAGRPADEHVGVPHFQWR